MSPDQARGEIFEATSDVYSLGCVFYETLSGINPFRGQTALETISRHANLELPPFSETIPDVSVDPELEKTISRMLEKSPKMRYQTVSEVKQAIDVILDRFDTERGGIRLRRIESENEFSIDDRLWKIRRPPDAILFGIVCGCTLLALGMGFLVMNRTADDANARKKIALPKTANTTTLSDEPTHSSYIEDMIMPNSKKNDAYLKTLKETGDLRNVNLRMSDVTDDGVKSIQHLPIVWLDLSYTAITDRSLEYVSHMPQLCGLYLTGSEVTVNGIKQLSKMEHLQFLDVSAIPTSKDGLRSIAAIPNLTRLYMISVPNLSADVLSELIAAKKLSGLGFRRSSLDHNSLVVLGKLKSVNSLIVSYCGLTDEDLAPLKQLNELTLLDICGNDITDKGLMYLADFKSLRQLHVGNCPKVTKTGIDRFKKKHKNCAVRLDLGPNMLGNDQM